MSSKPFVVLGEAQESDAEEEIDSSAISKSLIEPSKGKIVFGEAPESDEENCNNTGSLDSISSAASALSLPSLNSQNKTLKKHQSILVKKLCERNASLSKNINEFVEQLATNAGNELNATNKKLLKCQLQMQEGVDYLKILNSTLTGLDSALQMLLSIQYLPNIKVEENADQQLYNQPFKSEFSQ